jgi:hypothetical protein
MNLNIHEKLLCTFYLLSDDMTKWTLWIDESTTCSDILVLLSKKLSAEPKDLQLYACFQRSKDDVEEHERIDPESGLYTIRDELKLTRESKFRFGVRLPVGAVVVNPPLPETSVPSTGSGALCGYLLKKGEGAAALRWKRRWFSLDRQAQRIYYAERDTSETPINYIDLHSVAAIPVIKGEWDVAVTFELTTARRVYEFKCSTPEERTRWVTAVNDALRDQQRSEKERQLATVGAVTERPLLMTRESTLRIATSPSRARTAASSMAPPLISAAAANAGVIGAAPSSPRSQRAPDAALSSPRSPRALPRLPLKNVTLDTAPENTLTYQPRVPSKQVGKGVVVTLGDNVTCVTDDVVDSFGRRCWRTHRRGIIECIDSTRFGQQQQQQQQCQ